jgi:fluoroquinolone resistance protein
MEQIYTEGKTFDKNNFITIPLAKGEYECCVFRNCDFSNSTLADVKFIDCEFLACNLSLAKLTKTIFTDVKFRDCKMLGLIFENRNDFGLTVNFENCNLNHSSFFQTKIKKTSFKNSQLHEVDFTQCDLAGAVFDNCDLSNAKFENTVLEKADFRTSSNYSIDPDLNRIKKTKFSLSGIAGLLGKYNIEIDHSN